MKRLMFSYRISKSCFFCATMLLIASLAAAVCSQNCYALTEDDQAESGLINEASICLSKKDYAQADKLLKAAWEMNPQSAEVCLLWGKLYRDQGRKMKAEKLFKKAIELKPDNENAYKELGALYRQQGDSAKARSFVEKALTVNPKNESAGAELKNILVDEYKKILVLNPKDQETAIKLGSVYAQQGKFTEAEGMFSYVIRLNAKSDLAFAELGWLAIKRKNTVKAREFSSQALIINPKNESAIRGIAQLSQSKESPSV